MAKFNSPLENVRIAAPCSANWDEMNGDARVRHCGSCQLNVYNLSEMTRREAEKLLIEREGSLCVRFYRRTDGTIITCNCPRGVAALKRRLSQTATAVFSAAFTFLAGFSVFSAVSAFDSKRAVQGALVESPVRTGWSENTQEEQQVSERYQTMMGANASFPVQGKPAPANSAQTGHGRAVPSKSNKF